MSRQPPLLIIFAEAIQHINIVKQFKILTSGLRTGLGEKYQGDLTLLPNNPSANEIYKNTAATTEEISSLLEGDIKVIFPK